MHIARPFVKWVGGKSRLLEQFESLYPQELRKGFIENYFEPFLGGGALYFSIAEKYKIKNAYLSDVNGDLILTYKVIQKKHSDLLEFLAHYQEMYDKTSEKKRYDLFREVRKHFNDQRFEINYKKLSDNWIPRAAQFIFLNKTCFNGLFRLNSHGEFNVPFGKYDSINIVNEENTRAVSKILRNARIVHADYSDCYDKITAKSFVYFDPPYRPLTQTASFTAYTGTEFNDARQVELSLFFQKVDKKKKAKLMLSNSDPANVNPGDNFFRKAYSGYTIIRVCANRSVNCDGAKRGRISELVITNYMGRTG
ncbi:MAG: Dam family site-specific DNA-(adenine-N6)-methyltransferase [Spirochaetales bacterium]|nr:Dam family site-specific DNA-(adenine-N6)-methyltransferase [Spirochaetales bacterium]